MRQRLLLLMSFLLMCCASWAQNITVKGTVTDSLGKAMPGVSVHIPGTTKGVTSGISGDYAISVPKDGLLEFSYIGYKTVTEPVSGREQINITLIAGNAQLEQVVVVGYGAQRKKDLTGSVAVVTAADIANRPIVNAGEALQGKAAGVQVTSNSGKPGAGLSIRVRGSTSISASNDPLYIVDGIQTTDISAYNPNDIESISILKDAASTAIYGTRGANGVVIITTKKGANGKSRVEANMYYGTTSPTKRLDVLNGQQYQQYMNESYGPGTITDSMVKANNVNWPDEVFRHGNQQNYQLAESGGNDKTTHYVSLNYNKQKGMILPTEFDRVTARANLTSKATNWLTLTTSNILSRVNSNDITDNQGVARGGVVLSALGTPPTVGHYTANGQIAQNPLSGWENPLGAIEGQTTRNRTDRLISSMGADVKFFKDLVFNSRFGIDYTNYRNQYAVDPLLTQNGRNQQGFFSQTSSTQLVWLSEQTLNYSHAWEQHHFSALAGWTAQESKWDQTYISASKLPVAYRLQGFDQKFDLSTNKNPSSKSIDEWAMISYLGRINYDFAGKYLFQANVRMDKSSKFAPGNRNATFPSLSAGWRISQEDFMRDVKVINDLKLRAGWGKVGNQEGIPSYARYTTSSINANDGSLSYNNIAPLNLGWENTTQTNIGVDITLLDRRLTATADFYVKKTKDLLVNVPVGGEIVSSFLLNSAKMTNIGEEFSLSSKNIVGKNFNWNTDFNISFNKNKVDYIVSGVKAMPSFGSIYERGNAVALATGYGLGEFYGYKAAGVDPNTGNQLYLRRDGKAVPYSQTSPDDRQYLGSAQPDFIYGMNNTFSYKNFDLTVFVQGSQGNKIFNGLRVETEGMKDSRNQSTAILSRWQKPGDATDMPGVSPGNNDNSQISTRFLENGSYLRFKTITLAYRFNPSLLNKIGLGSASLYVSAQNLFTITKYKGFDPEVNTYGNDGNLSNKNVALGVDYGAYPQPKVILVGLNLSLK
ncbi:SusC/RagA family TonB-linked outer membrane protein [Deminuibacter soli]|uniref:TonB-dependent receptor n=1 Tax=Deminuibacter soli TaxID=2291815 RepID=A0A3E1NES4_9BACT|nr:TonB-dependent receptor [Deminuibacter soli]RFM26362.1 TonB-dependent receptor [Deminuibacter soli]